MPRFAANLTMMFNEVPFLERFGAAAKAGFRAVEYLFPYEHPPEAIRDALLANGLTQALFNMPPGDWAAGDRGMASLPERHGEFRVGVETALTYAKATGCRRLHMMAGLSDPTARAHRTAYREAAAYAADQLGAEGIELLLEPINGRDMPGFFLNDFRLAEDIIGELGRPNIRLQFDIYHRQIIHGDVTMALRKAMPLIGHIQIASIPSRHEPDAEELNYPFLFAELDRLGYDGFVGCEYRPRAGTLEGLGWFAPWRAA